MKKLYYLMAISCMFLSLPLTSCSDDDDDEVIEEATGDTTGDTTPDEPTTDETTTTEVLSEVSMNGYIYVNVGGTAIDPAQQEITIDENSDGTITLIIPDFKFVLAEGTDPLEFGDLNVVCTVSGEEFTGTASVVYLVVPIDFDLTGTYDGTNITFTSSFAVGVTVALVYEGSIDGTELNENIDWSFAEITDNTEEGGEEIEVSDSTEYTGTVNASYSLVGDPTSLDPITNVTAVVGTTDEGETIVSIDAEISINVLFFNLKISDITINCGEIGSDGAFVGTVTFALEGSTQDPLEISGTISEDGGLELDATFNYLGIADISVSFTTE